MYTYTYVFMHNGTDYHTLEALKARVNLFCKENKRRRR